ncbi:MAG TPA: hypothetical protein VFY34_15430 [Pyrinomonadaceae bacterium]|nr:hypothetical protein [Pyrinomonadaceae bacterium]
MESQKYLLLLILLLAAGLTTQAQQPKSAAEEAENLRLQLIDVQTQQESLRARAAELDEAIKPENIQRSLAGVGSTRPEELREARRKQLQIERDAVAAQLRILDTSRSRLEAAILDADARAYHESAGLAPEASGMLSVQSLWGKRWLLSGGVGGFVVAFAAGLFVRRRLRNRLKS